MKILASDKLAKEGLDLLKKSGFQAEMITGLAEDELCKIIGEYDALVVRSETKVTAKIIEAGKKLKIIARAGVGVDNVDLNAATKKGIIVVNSPGGNTEAAAEHTFAMLLSLVRHIPQARASLKECKWERSKFKGIELYQKTLGLVGLGKIGARVAEFALSFNTRVIAYDPFVTEERAKAMGVELYKDLDSLLKEADFISFHIPKNKETAGLINKDKIKLMKKGVRLVNCARGGIIVENDLLEALQSGQVGGAALDVFDKEPCTDSPLAQLENVIAVPHLGASTEEAQFNVAIDVVEQIIDVLKGGQARSAVNIPSMKPEVINKVKPFMPLAEKLGILAGNLAQGAIQSVAISYFGQTAENEVAPLTIAVLKGMLSGILEESVNYVNAPVIAKERGLDISETKNAKSDFANLISIKIKTEKGQREVGGVISGTLGEHLVSIDNLRVEAVPQGYMLILSNIDKPGMIGKVGTLLGQHKVNIAGMDVGRIKQNEKAVMVLNIDAPVDKKVLEALTKIEGIFEAVAVKF